jgi:hypothetical protein
MVRAIRVQLNRLAGSHVFGLIMILQPLPKARRMDRNPPVVGSFPKMYVRYPYACHSVTDHG